MKNLLLETTLREPAGKLGAYRVLVGKPEGMRSLGRPRRRWGDNIKMDVREVGWGHGLE